MLTAVLAAAAAMAFTHLRVHCSHAGLHLRVALRAISLFARHRAVFRGASLALPVLMAGVGQ